MFFHASNTLANTRSQSLYLSSLSKETKLSFTASHCNDFTTSEHEHTWTHTHTHTQDLILFLRANNGGLRSTWRKQVCLRQNHYPVDRFFFLPGEMGWGGRGLSCGRWCECGLAWSWPPITHHCTQIERQRGRKREWFSEFQKTHVLEIFSSICLRLVNNERIW